MPEYLLSALTFPAIDPVIFQIGPVAIRWYGLGYVVGILFGWWYSRRLAATPRLWANNQPAMTPVRQGTGGIPHPLAGMLLLDLDSSASFFQFFLDGFGFVLGHTFFNCRRHAFHQVFGLFQTKASDFAHYFNNIDFLFTKG